MKQKILHQGDFIDRVNFAEYLNHRRMVGLAAEIGTHQGHFAHQFLGAWNGRILYCIDPWTVPEGYEEQAQFLPGKGVDRHKDMAEARSRLRRYGDRAELVQKTSLVASYTMWDDSLDFVYIDADHRYEHVLQDLRVWYPKLKPGGLLAGHDFLSRPLYPAYLDVQRAVVDFANEKELEIYIVAELAMEPEFQPWSFYMIKPSCTDKE